MKRYFDFLLWFGKCRHCLYHRGRTISRIHALELSNTGDLFHGCTGPVYHISLPPLMGAYTDTVSDTLEGTEWMLDVDRPMFLPELFHTLYLFVIS
jgi:hypothetical protein